jgi:hypothetical protein
MQRYRAVIMGVALAAIAGCAAKSTVNEYQRLSVSGRCQRVAGGRISGGVRERGSGCCRRKRGRVLRMLTAALCPRANLFHARVCRSDDLA